MKDPALLGAKLGPRIAQIVTTASAISKRGTLPLSHKLAMQVQHDFFNLTGHEIEANAAHLFDAVANHPDTPAPYKRLFGFMSRGYGQWQTLLATSVTAQALAPTILATLNNDLAPVQYDLISANPNTILPPAQLADLANRGLVDDGYATDQAAKGGINANRFDLLKQLSLLRLPPDQLAQLALRGHIGTDDALAFMATDGMGPFDAQGVLNLAQVLQSPSVLAEAVVKGLLDAETGAQIAAQSGLSRTDFELLTLTTGDSLDTTSLSEAYRRGIIDKERLVHGIRTGLLRNEWVDVVEALRFSPPSPAEAIDAAVQNHLSKGDAQNIASLSGLDPQYFEWLYETAGSPLAPGQMQELYNRGLVTEDQVKQAVREGRTKDKYVDLSFLLHRKLIEARQIVTGISVGAITKAEAVTRLTAEGYSAEDVQLLIAEGVKQRTAPVHNLAYSQIVELYQAKAITRADAVTALQALHYDTHQIDSLLALADLTSARKTQTTVIAAVRAQYLANVIGEAQAQTDLDAAHVHPDERDALLGLWDTERKTPTKQLTVAQLGKIVKAGGLTVDDFLVRVAGLGYSEGDAQLLAIYEGLVTPAPPTTTGGTSG